MAETPSTKPPVATTLFEDLPTKARKRRKLEPVPVAPTDIGNPEKPVSNGVGIAPLDPTHLCGSQRIGIIGLPGTGKSTCCKSLLADLCHSFPVINVFSGSEGDNPFYSDMIPKLFIQNKISQKGLKMFVNRQRLAIGYDAPLKDALLILDDCFETPQQLDNSTMRILFKQGRHLRASVWVVQQYVVDLPPVGVGRDRNRTSNPTHAQTHPRCSCSTVPAIATVAFCMKTTARCSRIMPHSVPVTTPSVPIPTPPW